MLKQKFRRGNLVHIIDGSCQSNFEQGCDAVILGSYDDQYGTGNIFRYEVLMEDGNRVSWYHDEQLELIDSGGEHLIEKIQEGKNRREAKRILRDEDLEDLNDHDIRTLLRFIGFDYSKGNNYFGMWDEVLPLFKEIKMAASPDKLKVAYPKYDIEGVWKLLH